MRDWWRNRGGSTGGDQIESAAVLFQVMLQFLRCPIPALSRHDQLVVEGKDSSQTPLHGGIDLVGVNANQFLIRIFELPHQVLSLQAYS